MVTYKICRYCKTNKEFSKFGQAKKSKDGLQSYCKDCMTTYQRKIRKRNKNNNLKNKNTGKTKKCSICKKEKPMSEFGRYITNKDRNERNISLKILFKSLD